MSANPTQSIRRLLKAAEQGDVKAAGQLGWIYFHGSKPAKLRLVRGKAQVIRDPVQDYRKAVVWLRQAAHKGHIDSMHGLAICHLTGQGEGIQLWEQGMHWLREAAKCGVSSAQLHLGRVLQEGLYQQKVDGRQALAWFKKAAQCADRQVAGNALDRIWQMYYHGQGVRRNYRTARRWITQALKLGEEEGALAAMARMYRQGLGVKASRKKALVWEKRRRDF